MFFRPQKLRFLFVTHNPHKAEEIKRVFPPQHEVITLKDLEYEEDIPETGKTLEENALIKAHHMSELSGYSSFADDTGLEVEALNGAPGVYSARYAGESASDTKNVQKLLKELDNNENRRARFRTVIALIQNKQEYLFEGEVQGTILKALRGESGFGYDPIFLPDGSDKSFAEMEMKEKNRISHRGRAVNKLIRHINMLEVKRLRFWF